MHSNTHKQTLTAEGRQNGHTSAIAEKPLLTRKEAAAILNLSERTIRRYELAGMLTSIHLTKRNVRYRRCDLEAMLNRFETGGRH